MFGKKWLGGIVGNVSGLGCRDLRECYWFVRGDGRNVIVGCEGIFRRLRDVVVSGKM